jgi:NHS family xanthosine MFS transporter
MLQFPLSNSVAYNILKKTIILMWCFPPIGLGTIGFIAAMWMTNLSGNKASVNMFYISGLVLILGIYSLHYQMSGTKSVSKKCDFNRKLD